MTIRYSSLHIILLLVVVLLSGKVTASEILFLKETHSYVLEDLENYESHLTIEGISLVDDLVKIPVSVNELSELQSLELFVKKKEKWKKVNISNEITISTIDYSSFFSGVKKYLLHIPSKAHFRIELKLKEKHSIFLTKMYKKGYYEAQDVRYHFSIPVGMKLSTNQDQEYAGNVHFMQSDFSDLKSIAYLIHPDQISPADYYSKWFEERINPQFEIASEKIPVELTELANTADRKALAQACFDYVKKQIKYIDIENGINAVVPRGCEATLENKLGDCKDMATLLTALYMSFGFEAYFSVSRTNSKDGTLDFPSIGLANHVICTLILDGEYYFLDATESTCLFGDPSIQILGTEVFLVGHSDGYFLEVPNMPRSKSQSLWSYNYNFESSKVELQVEARGKLNSFFSSVGASNSNPKKYFEQLFKFVSKKTWKVSDLQISDTLTKISLSTAMSASSYSKVGGKKYYDLSFIPSLKMFSGILYNSKYPLFKGDVEVEVSFDGDILSEERTISFGELTVAEETLTIQMSFDEFKDEDDFIESNIIEEWDQFWSKPIVVAYEE